MVFGGEDGSNYSRVFFGARALRCHAAGCVVLCNEWSAARGTEALRAGRLSTTRLFLPRGDKWGWRIALLVRSSGEFLVCLMPLGRKQALFSIEPYAAAATALTRAYSSQQRNFHDCGVAIAAVAHRLQTRRVSLSGC